jgi:23S rRNA pseudouridine1911/1915/1917 synthase
MKISVSSSDELKRLDSFLSKRLVQFSRTNIQKMITNGLILVNEEKVKKNFRLSYSDNIDIDLTSKVDKKKVSLEKWDYPLDIIYQDKDFAIINKPRGVIVHPAQGNHDKTLVNILLHRFDKELKNAIDPSRPGIVHRLDKDTSGILLVAKSDAFRNYFINEMQERRVIKKYIAVVSGDTLGSFEINDAIGRDKSNRTKMSIRQDGKEALTYVKLKEKIGNYSILDIRIETGRTHQIRVHLASKKLPIIGDKTYDPRRTITKDSSQKIIDIVRSFPRQALHARCLAFKCPETDEEISFETPIPKDVKKLIGMLKKHI